MRRLRAALFVIILMSQCLAAPIGCAGEAGSAGSIDAYIVLVDMSFGLVGKESDAGKYLRNTPLDQVGDSRQYARKAADLFVNLLSDDDYVAVRGYDGVLKPVDEKSGFMKADASGRERASSIITRLTTGHNCGLGVALKWAGELIDRSEIGGQNVSYHLVLFSGRYMGFPQVDGDAGPKLNEQASLIEKYKLYTEDREDVQNICIMLDAYIKEDELEEANDVEALLAGTGGFLIMKADRPEGILGRMVEVVSSAGGYDMVLGGDSPEAGDIYIVCAAESAGTEVPGLKAYGGDGDMFSYVAQSASYEDIPSMFKSEGADVYVLRARAEQGVLPTGPAAETAAVVPTPTPVDPTATPSPAETQPPVDTQQPATPEPTPAPTEAAVVADREVIRLSYPKARGDSAQLVLTGSGEVTLASAYDEGVVSVGMSQSGDRLIVTATGVGQTDFNINDGNTIRQYTVVVDSVFSFGFWLALVICLICLAGMGYVIMKIRSERTPSREDREQEDDY